jgi:hypothetical protein
LFSHLESQAERDRRLADLHDERAVVDGYKEAFNDRFDDLGFPMSSIL